MLIQMGRVKFQNYFLNLTEFMQSDNLRKTRFLNFYLYIMECKFSGKIYPREK